MTISETRALAEAREIVDRWSRGEGTLHEAITAAILAAEQRGAEMMRERAAEVARAHDPTPERQKKWGHKFGRLSESAREEILAEERGERIAATLIGAAIRDLSPAPPSLPLSDRGIE